MKISGGAWKLVLAGFCSIGVLINFLLGNTFTMIFWLACIFGLVVWYGWTYQDRKAEYDETRANIAKTEEHLKEMQEELKKAKTPAPVPAPAPTPAYSNQTPEPESTATNDSSTSDNSPDEIIAPTIRAHLNQQMKMQSMRLILMGN